MAKAHLTFGGTVENAAGGQWHDTSCGDDPSLCDDDRAIMQWRIRIENLQEQFRRDMGTHLDAGVNILIEVIHSLDYDQSTVLTSGKSRGCFHNGPNHFLYIFICFLVGRLDDSDHPCTAE